MLKDLCNHVEIKFCLPNNKYISGFNVILNLICIACDINRNSLEYLFHRLYETDDLLTIDFQIAFESMVTEDHILNTLNKDYIIQLIQSLPVIISLNHDFFNHKIYMIQIVFYKNKTDELNNQITLIETYLRLCNEYKEII